MPAGDADAKIRWEDGEVPVSSRFDDSYYSREDGLAETRHVFLDGNRLGECFAGAGRFAIAELGFGTGLNCLAAALLWAARAAPGAVLSYTAFELYPLEADEIARALAPWTEVAPLAEALVAAWPAGRIALPGVELRVVRGDARQEVPRWPGRADAWFLDGFAPARNPEMWELALMRSVHDRTVPGGTFATYAAAGRVRRALQAAGFEVVRLPGFGRKREMLAGRRD
jgi:tRNA U34 5-methylaminomethyl-2-thiouridine-forming methyltransferase MnmC